MKLKRLTLQGFKSFKDKTTVNFDNGITGIVGPNGCGKSNIVDALFWVMGAQSAKHLRGDKMKDLIFSGSSKYKPGAWAEVTLCLENDTNKHVNISNKVYQPAEIEMTRKLYRNGETEYRINGIPARLKDIHEVFMDTGAGAKSYSIIAQGEINRLVAAKPIERRTMIEEVAGITKYKLRKRDSMKKIEQTEQNLNRLQDLQAEIDKNLKNLQRQAEKAERARNLKEKIRRYELIVESHKVHDFLKDYREAKTYLNEKTLDMQNWTLRRDDLELGLEEERIRKDELTENLDEKQAEFNEMSKILAAAEERLNYLRRTLDEKTNSVEKIEKEIEDTEAESIERKAKLLELVEQKEELIEASKEEVDFDELEMRVEEFKETYEEHKTQLEDLRALSTEANDEFKDIDNELFRIQSKVEDLARNLEDIALEIESLEGQYSSVSRTMIDEREAVNTLSEDVETLTTEVDTLKSEIEVVSVANDQNESEYKRVQQQLITTESKLNSLIEIQQNLEGAKEGAKNFLASELGEGFFTLGQILQSEKEFSGGVQAVIGDLLDTVVVLNGEDRVRTWCSDNDQEALDLLMPIQTFGSPSTDLIERLELNGLAGVRPLAQVVKIEEVENAEKIMSLFDGYYLAENLTAEVFAKMPKDMNFKGLVSYDGQYLVRKDGNSMVISLNSVSESGAVDRNNQIEELRAAFERLTTENTELSEAVTQSNADLKEKVELHEMKREELANKRADYAAKKSSIESKETNFKANDERLEILKKRKADLSGSRLELQEKEEELLNNKESLQEKVENFSANLEEKTEEVETARSQYEDAREEFTSKQVQIQTFKTKVEAIENQSADVELSIEKLSERGENQKLKLEEVKEEIEKLGDEGEELETENHKEAEALSERESHLSDLKDQLADLLTGMMDRENEVKELNSKIAKTDKTMHEKNVRIEQIIEEEEQVTRNVFEKYQIDLRFTLSRFLDINEDEMEGLKDLTQMYLIETEDGTKEIAREEYEFVKKFPGDIRDYKGKLKNSRTDLNRLGEINWQAIEDYDRQKLRSDFLKEQEVELKKSLEDLSEAILHIDTKSKARFKEAFTEVNTRFMKVFPIIFGGGTAELKIVGNLDDAECGIDIMVQPPGKKNQSINLLSGGEKALTALSLIFSIFLVKPSPFCLLDEVDAPLDDANVGRFNQLLREMSSESQFVLITHNKKTMELNDTLYGVTMQEPGVSKAVSVQLH